MADPGPYCNFEAMAQAKKQKRVIVSVSNDLNTDQRVHKVCLSLQKMGFDVWLVGRIRPDSKPMESRPYHTKRMRMLFHVGATFYAWFNLRLFFFLLFRKADLLVSNDLDTLLANCWVKKFKKVRLVYDSHEYFTEVPELVTRPAVQRFWKRIEQKCIPKADAMYTVNDSIASMYSKEYQREVKVVRNLPLKKNTANLKPRTALGLPENRPIVLLQGAWINVDRGGEEAVAAMQYLDNVLLLIIGGGDVIGRLKAEVKTKQLGDKVWFRNKMPYHELAHYTANADIGLSLDKDTNINYRFSLPNKLFDYMHAGIAILASDLIEVRKVLERVQCGCIVEEHHPKAIAAALRDMLSDPQRLDQWKNNARTAAGKWSWEEEEKVLKQLYGIAD